MADLTFYTNPMSRGRIVRWMLEELGEPYETRIVGLGEGSRDPAYLAINPMGKVPAIDHGGVVVTEGAAICAYLADAFPAAGLCPAPTAPERGPYLRWLFFGAGPVEAAVTNRALGMAPTQDQEIMVGYGSMERVLDTLSGLLTRRDWVTGTFSAADVYLGAQVGWGLAFKTLDPRPGFEDYAHRCAERPAAIRARRIDGGLLQGAGS